MKTLTLTLVLLLAACASPAQKAQVNADSADSRNRAMVHTQLGAGYLERAQLGVALQELNAAVAADPKYSQAHNMLGLVYMQLRENPRAEESFRRALQTDGNNSDAHNNYGWFLCQQDRVDESIPHFLSALKDPLYTTPERSYLNAGLCSLKKNDIASAEDFFQKALKISANQPQVYLSLAQINFNRERLVDSKFNLEKYMQFSEPSAEALWLGVRLARKLQDRGSELSYGQQLRRKYPDSREAIALRSGIYE